MKNRYIYYARKAIQYVKRILSHGSINKFSDQQRQTYQQDVDALVDLRKSIQMDNQTMSRLCQALYLNALHKIVAKYAQAKVGNCAEQTRVALSYLISIGIYNVDLIDMKNGDHEFIVIGRAKHSNPNNIRTWGANAIICDPWADMVYCASDFFKVRATMPEFKYADILNAAYPNARHFLFGNPYALRQIHLDRTAPHEQLSLKLSAENSDDETYKRIMNLYHQYLNDKSVYSARNCLKAVDAIQYLTRKMLNDNQPSASLKACLIAVDTFCCNEIHDLDVSSAHPLLS